jgi:hypothetical protein
VKTLNGPNDHVRPCEGKNVRSTFDAATTQITDADATEKTFSSQTFLEMNNEPRASGIFNDAELFGLR